MTNKQQYKTPSFYCDHQLLTELYSMIDKQFLGSWTCYIIGCGKMWTIITFFFIANVFLSYEGSPQELHQLCLHTTLSLTSSSVTPNLSMLSFTTSTNLLFGLFLLPRSSSFSIICPVHPVSLLCKAKPSQPFLSVSKALNLRCPSDTLISNPLTRSFKLDHTSLK